jgi:hypothetical protein
MSGFKQHILDHMTKEQMADELVEAYINGSDGWTPFMNQLVMKYEDDVVFVGKEESMLSAWKHASGAITEVHGCEGLGDEEFDHIMQDTGVFSPVVENCIKGLVPHPHVIVGVAKSLRHLEKKYPSAQFLTDDITWNRMAAFVESLFV